jgi:hypothetical protein
MQIHPAVPFPMPVYLSLDARHFGTHPGLHLPYGHNSTTGNATCFPGHETGLYPLFGPLRAAPYSSMKLGSPKRSK